VLVTVNQFIDNLFHLHVEICVYWLRALGAFYIFNCFATITKVTNMKQMKWVLVELRLSKINPHERRVPKRRAACLRYRGDSWCLRGFWSRTRRSACFNVFIYAKAGMVEIEWGCDLWPTAQCSQWSAQDWLASKYAAQTDFYFLFCLTLQSLLSGQRILKNACLRFQQLHGFLIVLLLSDCTMALKTILNSQDIQVMCCFQKIVTGDKSQMLHAEHVGNFWRVVPNRKCDSSLIWMRRFSVPFRPIYMTWPNVRFAWSFYPGFAQNPETTYYRRKVLLHSRKKHPKFFIHIDNCLHKCTGTKCVVSNTLMLSLHNVLKTKISN